MGPRQLWIGLPVWLSLKNLFILLHFWWKSSSSPLRKPPPKTPITILEITLLLEKLSFFDSDFQNNIFHLSLQAILQLPELRGCGGHLPVSTGSGQRSWEEGPQGGRHRGPGHRRVRPLPQTNHRNGQQGQTLKVRRLKRPIFFSFNDCFSSKLCYKGCSKKYFQYYIMYRSANK